MNWFISNSSIMIFTALISSSSVMFLETPMLLSIDLSSFLELPLSISVMVDSQSLTFISTVSTVSSLIIIYSFFYFENSPVLTVKKFTMILIVFILSMFILSLSANIFWLMIGWDGLGISSFCLIIFYQNWKSFNSGTVTFLSNRLGDTFIILSSIWMMFDYSLNAWMIPSLLLTSFLLGVGAYSKSAQLPFLFWLPQAMAAPTPVSALVHSSTLVTAGIFLVCRFQPMQNSQITSLIFFSISCITVIIAGTSSLVEFDLKKVIALSTLCHISLMMMFAVMGETNLSLFHFMTHAFFKSTLFMIAGFLIHHSYNSQDIRLISISSKELSISFPFFLSIFSMMGFPFLSGFYSKEALLAKSSYSLSNISMIVMFLANSFFSCAYSSRLVSYIFSGHSKTMTCLNKSPFSSIFVAGSFFGCFIGGLVMPFLQEESEIQLPLIKLSLLLCSLLGIITGMKINFINPFFTINNILLDLWKSNFLYKIIQTHFFFSSYLTMWKLDEKGTVKTTLKNISNKNMKMAETFLETTMKQPFSSIKSLHLLCMTWMIWLI